MEKERRGGEGEGKGSERERIVGREGGRRINNYIAQSMCTHTHTHTPEADALKLMSAPCSSNISHIACLPLNAECISGVTPS